MSAEVTPSIQPGILLATLASPQSVCSLASVSARERNISSPSYQSASIAVLTRASVASSTPSSTTFAISSSIAASTASASVVGLYSANTVNSVGPSYSQRSEEHTSELQSLIRHSYAVFCLHKKTITPT